MANKNIQDSNLMPKFNIDTIRDSNGQEIPGIKKMYEIAFKLKDSLMQWGAPGIGKSQAVLQWNDEMVKKCQEDIDKGVPGAKPWCPYVVDVRLSMKEPVDMVGVPIPVKGEDGKVSTQWATPSMWPTQEEGEKYAGGIIHLDEINQGQAAILNAAFQLIQDRRLGEYKVPESFMIIASANPPAYNSTVTELSVPLANRFSHFNVVPNFDSWLDYRLNHGGNVDVMSYLKSQALSMFFDEKTMKRLVGDTSTAMFTDIVVTPRSWEIIERLMELDGFTLEEKQRYATGRLGLSEANNYFMWYKNQKQYQDWKDILVKGNDFKSEEASQYWVTQMNCLAAIANCQDDTTVRSYIVNFVNATKKLKAQAFRITNITQLARLDRVRGNLKLFNPIKDAESIVDIAIASIKR